MYIAVLGRQPALGMAELEQLYGSGNSRWFSNETALIDSDQFDFERLGGTQKAGIVTLSIQGNWHQITQEIVAYYSKKWHAHQGKITLGLSVYGLDVPARDVQKTGIVLKSKLKTSGVSLRLIPNAASALNTATSHHNKLGLSPNHVELLIVRGKGGSVVVAESVGAQNITALAARDQARPRTDAFVGMLPPKLARMMVNLSGLTDGRVLDPFCGTGVTLQEAALLGFSVYGSDLSEKMVAYSVENLQWLTEKYHITPAVTIEAGDAMNHHWSGPINCVVAETYLGQPFSAPPSPAKLAEVTRNCTHIIGSFLANIAPQLASGTPLVLAVPAWRSKDGSFTHLPLARDLDRTGFQSVELTHVAREQLLYYRETQVVARELLLLKKK